MDDMCNGPGAEQWALANGFNADQAAIIGGAIDHCFLYNPGGDLTANIDLEDGKGFTQITIPAASLGFDKPVRKWTALEFTFERAWDGVWSLQGSYVWAKSRGNTEGYVKSDIGQDDAGISQDWDYPGLMEGAYGYLPCQPSAQELVEGIDVLDVDGGAGMPAHPLAHSSAGRRSEDSAAPVRGTTR